MSKDTTNTTERIDELKKVLSGVNVAAVIRTPTAGARLLNIDDLNYYLYNRIRVLEGKKSHTPEEWLEAER